MKRFAIDSVDAVQAAELQMPGALGARDGHFGWALRVDICEDFECSVLAKRSEQSDGVDPESSGVR